MCLINKPLVKSCSYAVAGISEVYLTNLVDVQGVSQSATGSTIDEITAFTPSGLVWYKVDHVELTASADDSLTKSNNNDYFTHTLRYSYSEDNNSARLYHTNLGKAKVVAIVKTKSGLYKVLGLKNGLQATVINHVSGAALGDAQGYTVELVGAEVTMALILDSALQPSALGDGEYNFTD
jgi:hypothetical protein